MIGGVSLTDIREALTIAIPLVFGAWRLWKRAKPWGGGVLTAIRTEVNKPVESRLADVEEDVEDLTIKVDTIVRMR